MFVRSTHGFNNLNTFLACFMGGGTTSLTRKRYAWLGMSISTSIKLNKHSTISFIREDCDSEEPFKDYFILVSSSWHDIM